MSNTGIAADQLRSFVERYERLEEEKKAISSDQKEVLAEAKGRGFDVPTIRRILKIRKIEKHDLQERSEMLSLYLMALGDTAADDPLAEWC